MTGDTTYMLATYHPHLTYVYDHTGSHRDSVVIASQSMTIGGTLEELQAWALQVLRGLELLEERRKHGNDSDTYLTRAVIIGTLDGDPFA